MRRPERPRREPALARPRERARCVGLRRVRCVGLRRARCLDLRRVRGRARRWRSALGSDAAAVLAQAAVSASVSVSVPMPVSVPAPMRLGREPAAREPPRQVRPHPVRGSRRAVGRHGSSAPPCGPRRWRARRASQSRWCTAIRSDPLRWRAACANGARGRRGTPPRRNRATPRQRSLPVRFLACRGSR